MTEHQLTSETKTKIPVREIMSPNVVTLLPNQTVLEAAKIMKKEKIGSIILEAKDGSKEAVGILTERDIVLKVVAENKDPTKVQVKKIASKPVITVKPSTEITDVMKLMIKKNIRRIIITDDDKCIQGVCTYRDLLRFAPEIIELAYEFERIGLSKKELEEEYTNSDEDYDIDDEKANPKGLSVGYYCSRCGNWCEEQPVEVEDGQRKEDLCPSCLDLID
jgi:CBS domain-containing protein